jgi:ABC-2 type transport system permease protein
MRKEIAVLCGSPMPYLSLTLVVLVTALIFFDHLRLYNQILFLYATSTLGGFETDTIPDYINLRDTVFFPVMETLGITLIGVVPLVTMRVFAEERARGTDEFLVTTHLSAGQIVLAKFAVTYLFVTLMMGASFVYPAMAIQQGGIGAQHLLAIFLGLFLAPPSPRASSSPPSRPGRSVSCSGTSAGRASSWARPPTESSTRSPSISATAASPRAS